MCLVLHRCISQYIHKTERKRCQATEADRFFFTGIFYFFLFLPSIRERTFSSMHVRPVQNVNSVDFYPLSCDICARRTHTHTQRICDFILSRGRRSLAMPSSLPHTHMRPIIGDESVIRFHFFLLSEAARRTRNISLRPRALADQQVRGEDADRLLVGAAGPFKASMRPTEKWLKLIQSVRHSK